MNNRRHYHLSGNCQEQRPNVFICTTGWEPNERRPEQIQECLNCVRDNRQFTEASPRPPSPVQAALRNCGPADGRFPADPHPPAPGYVGPPDRLSLSRGHAAGCGTFWPEFQWSLLLPFPRTGRRGEGGPGDGGAEDGAWVPICREGGPAARSTHCR